MPRKLFFPDFVTRHPEFQSLNPDFESRDPELQSRDPEFESRDPEIKKITRVALMGHRKDTIILDELYLYTVCHKRRQLRFVRNCIKNQRILMLFSLFD